MNERVNSEIQEALFIARYYSRIFLFSLFLIGAMVSVLSGILNSEKPRLDQLKFVGVCTCQQFIITET